MSITIKEGEYEIETHTEYVSGSNYLESGGTRVVCRTAYKVVKGKLYASEWSYGNKWSKWKEVGS